MKVKDIMSTKVMTCLPETEIAALAQMMAVNGISGVPVLSEGQLVGIVSEGDLLRRPELGDAKRTPSWWLRILGTEQPASEYVKAYGRHARDIMTRQVVTVQADASLGDVAELFERHHIRRAPVVDAAGHLVGIVSRANFVQAIASASAEGGTESRDDDAIHESLAGELGTHIWWRSGVNSITVSGGVVHFWGFYNSEEELAAARVAAENTPGVTRVEEHRSRYPVAYA